VKPGPLALQRFADKWGSPDDLPERVDSGDLAIAEHRIGRRLPEAYVHAVTLVGLPRPTRSLLTSLIEADADASDIDEFLTPAEIVEHLDSGRSTETPDGFVGFATDCTGDRYGFLCPVSREARPADGAVFQLDHETGEVCEVAGSFLDWLLDYNGVPFVHFDAA
jgi:hypothetical protein